MRTLNIQGDVFCDSLAFSKILSGVSSCPSFKKLEILSLEPTEEDFEQAIHMERLPHPFVLELFHRDVENNVESIQELLRSHPEVRLTGAKCWYENNRTGREEFGYNPSLFHGNPPLKHIIDLNWNGRYLLDRPGVPLSLWPLVIERVADKPSCIFELLKGPAFATEKD